MGRRRLPDGGVHGQVEALEGGLLLKHRGEHAALHGSSQLIDQDADDRTDKVSWCRCWESQEVPEVSEGGEEVGFCVVREVGSESALNQSEQIRRSHTPPLPSHAHRK